jgi:hypothetical protein
MNLLACVHMCQDALPRHPIANMHLFGPHLYVCVYVCMYLWMHVRIFACVFVCTYACMHCAQGKSTSPNFATTSNCACSRVPDDKAHTYSVTADVMQGTYQRGRSAYNSSDPVRITARNHRPGARRLRRIGTRSSWFPYRGHLLDSILDMFPQHTRRRMPATCACMQLC